MTEVPQTRYARSGDVHIAYQVVGEGPIDFVFCPAFTSHVEFAWELDPLAYFYRGLASFARLIVFDKRGTGMSDRLQGDRIPTLEERMDDIRAVMDAAGSQRAAICGGSEAAPMGMLFAATYPERASALILLGGFAKGTPGDDYPWGVWGAGPDGFLRDIEEKWGTEYVGGEMFTPSIADLLADPVLSEPIARFQRLSTSPGATLALARMAMDTDVRSALPLISAPTLVIHAQGDRLCPVEGARYIAERIANARLVEFPGVDHTPVSHDELDAYLGEIQEFLTGVRPAPAPDRVLATVLFTDIVSSTRLASELGDKRWTQTLEAHDQAARRAVERFGGRWVKSTGDGVLATFDGPGRAVRCATQIRDAVKALGLDVRAGLHTGECEMRGEDISGVAVHLAQRVSALAGAGEVFVSRTITDLVAGSGLDFEDRGEHELKGVAGRWQVYAVKG